MEARYAWEFSQNKNQQLANELQQQCQLSPLLAQLLIQRGIDSVEKAKQYLDPQLAELRDPFELHDMQKAVDRIQAAVANGEKIVIYGDYDADGITSTAVMYETLDEVGAQVEFFIPNRFTDGYGPNLDEYQRLIDGGAQLIVTVDNGVSGAKEIEYANSRGVDVVITDHHELPEKLPEAAAIVHPKYPGSEYAGGDLSGVGVAFKTAWALTEEFPQEMLDLVAIGELADLVDVTGENRALITWGLKQLRQGMRPGLHQLVKLAKLNEDQLSDQDVGFGIAPRLNALGRIDDANEGVLLLTTMDDREGKEIAQEVENANQTRQQLVAKITNEALRQARASENTDRSTLLLLGHEWHQGVLGIVASRVVEETGKPTIVASVNDGDEIAKGSGRSHDGFDLFEALQRHRDLMTAFGGHAQACGMSFNIDQVEQLRAALEQEAKAQGLAESGPIKLDLASSLSPDDVNESLYDQLQRLAPFGPGNPEPVFAIHADRINNVKTMGKQQEHLKFELRGQKNSAAVVAFGKADLAPLLLAGVPVTIAATLGINEWHGKRTAQLMLKDIKTQGTAILDQRTRQLLPGMFNETGYYVAFDQTLRENIAGHAHGIVLDPQTALETDFKDQQVTIVDCPPDLAMLSALWQNGGQPAMIRLLLWEKHPVRFGLPNRQQFAMLYRFLRQYPEIANYRQQQPAMARSLLMPVEQLNWMITVFYEAKFVTINDGVLRLAEHPAHVELEQTKCYQQHAAHLKSAQVLLYSDTHTLRKRVAAWLMANE
ncbi:single-stranded-DNA-specific exonuclease RecJ [Limosilactobacillus mucosae]|uniref:single-stranded-DNA-specific exonuclease RecJ n=1 Tax=Limosilactobacillus mucosae TaxID=97478 RepID=UPI00233EC63B|nr:single-stranded-DNA-specific exonuclease RecJ [Limosilactobacillus mucosae]MDC2839144.1 single-stranded-DNA-specific exonuclease RecJ [Limosilactobacillus mucosae]